jgi:hypothetical protein
MLMEVGAAAALRHTLVAFPNTREKTFHLPLKILLPMFYLGASIVKVGLQVHKLFMLCISSPYHFVSIFDLTWL